VAARRALAAALGCRSSWAAPIVARSYAEVAQPPGEPSTVVQLSKQRMEALLDSEIIHFAMALKPHPITLQQILAHRDADSLREFLLEELPIRFARRLHLIESLPKWNNFPHMRVIRSLYSDAFRRLRCVPRDDADGFRSTLQNIKRRNSNMLMHVVRGTRAMKEAAQLPDDKINEFLDDFLTARIGTDILTSQYLAITRPNGSTSVIDPECDPVSVVRSAAGDATRLCKYHYGHAPDVLIVDAGKVRFPFIGQYLNYITFELLKNALRAVTERYDKAELPQHPVRVVVCGDDSTVVVRVSDSGGGIPLDKMDKVWSYLYTTAKPLSEDGENDPYDSDADEGVAPMAGFGCGLPLSRNYAAYVGGRLEVNTMPQHGTNAYLYLNRIGNAQEYVDAEPKAQQRLPSRGFLPQGQKQASQATRPRYR